MQKKFLIVGTQRTGTQALFTAFNSHPDVFCGGEWTQYVPWYQRLAIAKKALNGDISQIDPTRPQDEMERATRLLASAGWFGFKILFRSSDKWLVHPRFAPALMIDGLERHMAWLRRSPNISVIQLVRTDGMEWLKSKYLSWSTRKFMYESYPDDATVDIPVSSALRALESKNWVDQRLSGLSISNPYFRVTYEDFYSNNRSTLEACLRFMGCDIGTLPENPPFIARQSTKPASAYIRNYDELSAALDRRGLRASALLSS